jgi:hypothetical protein
MPLSLTFDKKTIFPLRVGKIVFGPGSEKKVKEYLIPIEQFNDDHKPMMKRLNEMRKIQELKNKIV